MKKLVCLVLALAMLLSLAAVPGALADNSTVFTADKPGKLTVGVYDRSNMNTDYGTAVDNNWTPNLEIRSESSTESSILPSIASAIT